jgi:Tfp pilus assembly protein PilF
MNPHLQRAQVSLRQHGPELAEESLRRALGEEPHLSEAHSLLALSLAAQKKLADAENAAGQAIGLAPDSAFAHYARASVLEDRNKPVWLTAFLSTRTVVK